MQQPRLPTETPAHTIVSTGQAGSDLGSLPAAPVVERIACVECDLLVQIGELGEHERATCPRCGHVLTAPRPDGLTRALAYTLAACVLLVLANTFPFLQLKAKGLEQVMTLPRTAIELYRDGYGALAVLVLGPIVGIPALILMTLLALLVPLRRPQPAPWLVPAGRFVSFLSPWSMVEVFVIGVLVSLVKIAAMATVVMGISFFAYVGFAVCFTLALSNLDTLEMWGEIEARTP
ncbi:MAG: paraquat-inducible protein A [Deltaproteobacteria bacterium]|nr:paraquat-inducible protein A [Deltaproteobacteria bacterium]